jgi:hypothetical protein
MIDGSFESPCSLQMCFPVSLLAPLVYPFSRLSFINIDQFYRPHKFSLQCHPTNCNGPHIARKRAWDDRSQMIVYEVTANLMAFNLLQFVLFGFMNTLASHSGRSYGYESAGDRPTCLARLFVSPMRLTPSGLTRYFVPEKILPINSKSFMQYAG